jgi:hypothetical protein
MQRSATHSNTATQQHNNTTTQQHSNTATQQHCNAATHAHYRTLPVTEIKEQHTHRHPNTQHHSYTHHHTPHPVQHAGQHSSTVLRNGGAALHTRPRRVHTAPTTPHTAHWHRKSHPVTHAASAQHSQQSCQAVQRRWDAAGELVVAQDQHPAGHTNSHRVTPWHPTPHPTPASRPQRISAHRLASIKSSQMASQSPHCMLSLTHNTVCE